MAQDKKDSKGKGLSPEAKVIAEARERFKIAEEAWGPVRKEALEDLRFLNGDQWDDNSKLLRQNRPCLTINRLPAYVDQVTGDIRNNTPSISIKPVDSASDVKTAEIIEGLIKNIENMSNADAVYETAAEQSASSSIGAYRILTQYTSDDSFEQDIIIKRIKNQFTVYPDPDFTEVDASDMNWCFVTETLEIKEFERLYPDTDTSGWVELSKGESNEGWFYSGRVRVAEYYRRKKEKTTICLLADGSVIEKGKYTPAPENAIVKERDAERFKVEWFKLAGNKIIEGPITYDIRYIPVIMVFGKELNLEGKTHYRSLIRWAKDPQRVYNYMRSSHVELVALSPKTPFIVTKEQIEGHENQWNQANTKPYPYLVVNETPGSMPQRTTPVMPQPGMLQEIVQASDEIKAVTSMFDPSMGAVRQDLSGKAIGKLQAQGNVANSMFIDNLARAVKHGGRVILDMIPTVYDTERVIRVLGKDGRSKFETINRYDPVIGSMINDLTVGKYDVVVTTGPSYATQRQEAADAQIQLIQAAPQLMQIVGDLVVSNFDWPGAQQMAERLKKTLPPNLLDDEDGKPKMPQGPDPMQQMAMKIELATKEAEIVKTMSDAILNMAKAEGVEPGNQIKQYLALVQGLTSHHQLSQPQPQMQPAASVALSGMDGESLAQLGAIPPGEEGY